MKQQVYSKEATVPWVVTIALGCGFLLGCEVPLSEVAGSVLINGKPAPPGLKIVFQPQREGAEPILSATDYKGRYQLIHRSGKTGIAAGTYVVSLGLWGEAAENPPELAAIKIPERYRTGSSTLECVVGRTATTFDIDIRAD
jgi:hypothetical protein